MMYGRTAKQIKIIALISFIVSSIGTVIIFMVQDDDLSSFYWLIPIAPIILTFGFMSLVLNFKKTILGFIKPIPILSAFIEYLKGYFYGIKALVWALKQPRSSVDKADTKVY